MTVTVARMAMSARRDAQDRAVPVASAAGPPEEAGADEAHAQDHDPHLAGREADGGHPRAGREAQGLRAWRERS